METKSNGSAVARTLVRLLARPRRNARSNRLQARPVVHTPLRRQEAGPAELYRSHPKPDSLQGCAAEKGETTGPLKERPLRRPGHDCPPTIRSRLGRVELLTLDFIRVPGPLSRRTIDCRRRRDRV